MFSKIVTLYTLMLKINLVVKKKIVNSKKIN